MTDLPSNCHRSCFQTQWGTLNGLELLHPACVIPISIMRIPIQSRTGMRLLVSPLGQCWSQFFGRCVGCRAALIMAVRPQHSIIPPFTSDCANAGERDIIGHCNVRATCNIAKLPWSPGGENGNWF